MQNVFKRLVAVTLVVGLISGVTAFAGDTRAPADLQVPEGPGLTTVATQSTGKAGDLFAVDVYLSKFQDLGAYQVVLSATGGTSGSLVAENVKVDRTRQDYVFKGSQVVEALYKERNMRIGMVRQGGGIQVPEPRYAGTYYFRASSDAKGTFTINAKIGPADSMATNSIAVDVPFTVGKASTINIIETKRARTDR
ncbi:MAG: hypothetical protein JSU63_11190 [Phycisphaerales bacterium]|nr:MAG: hypothetical protein JSU63_11190 [Phycisphaerales bacterium]